MNQKNRSTTSSTPIIGLPLKSQQQEPEPAHPDQIAPNIWICCFNKVADGHDPTCVHAIRANRLAMAIKRAKGLCEMRYSVSEGYESRCMGRPVAPFYTTGNRVRMLCNECWETQADYEQREKDSWISEVPRDPE